MLEIEDYAFPFGLCFSRPIMLKIMLAYCINAYSRGGGGGLEERVRTVRQFRPPFAKQSEVSI